MGGGVPGTGRLSARRHARRQRARDDRRPEHAAQLRKRDERCRARAQQRPAHEPHPLLAALAPARPPPELEGHQRVAAAARPQLGEGVPQRRGRRACRYPLVACGARAALTPRHAPIDGRWHVRVELQRDDLGLVPGVEHGAQQWQLKPVHVHVQCVELRRCAGGRQQRTDGRRQRGGPRDADAARRVVQREHFRPPRRRERHALGLSAAAAPVIDGIFLDGKPSPTRTEERQHRVERPLVVVQPLTVARADVDGEARPRHAHWCKSAKKETLVGQRSGASVRPWPARSCCRNGELSSTGELGRRQPSQRSAAPTSLKLGQARPVGQVRILLYMWEGYRRHTGPELDTGGMRLEAGRVQCMRHASSSCVQSSARDHA